MKNFYVYVVILAGLVFLSGCAVVRPVGNLVGGTLKVAGAAVGAAAKVAVKAAPAAAFLI